MIVALVVVLVVLVVLGLTAAAASVRVLREYERGVVFRLGRLVEPRGPGLVMLMPTIDRMVRVSLRTVTMTIPPQEVITRDNIPVRVTAVAYYRVIDPSRAVTEIESVHQGTMQISQTTLRSVLGGADLDTLLAEREHLNEALQHVIDAQTEPWGVKVTAVEIKDVEIPERMQHAIARQAEAERERRAKIINAEGEAQAAAKLAEAADVIGRNPTTLQLRYLQTLREIGGQSSTIVFPMPIDLIKPALDALGRASAANGGEAPPTSEPPGGQNALEGGEGSDRNALEGGETPDQSVLEVGETPDESALEGGETPDESALEGGETPDESALEGGETPEQNVLEGGETPEQSVLEVGETPDESALEGGETPEQNALSGGQSVLEPGQSSGVPAPEAGEQGVSAS